MHSKFMKLGSLFLAGALASFGAAVHADIHTSGVVCNNFNAGEAQDIDYLLTGVRNLNAAPRQVICAVPVEPIPAGRFPHFFVFGTNVGQATTPCVLTLYQFNGTITQLRAFTGSGPAWEFDVVLPVNSVGLGEFASLLCGLPGSGAGTLFGVHSFSSL